MSHAKNKVDWCLKKGEEELKERGSHRGLVRVIPNKERALEHIKKADHDIKAGIEFNKIGYSDWSAIAFFYSIYQCFLSIAAKFGYESGNQECTFALISYLIEDNQINLDKKLFDKVASLDVLQSVQENTSVKIREKYQYGTKLSLDEDLYNELLALNKKILSQTKEIIEQ